MNAKTEWPAIDAVVIEYLEGMIYGQLDRLSNAMPPLCMQAGHYNGEYEFFSRDEFIDSLADIEKVAPGSPYNFKIVSIISPGMLRSRKSKMIAWVPLSLII